MSQSGFLSSLPVQSAEKKKRIKKILIINELENLDLKFFLTALKQNGSSRINLQE